MRARRPPPPPRRRTRVGRPERPATRTAPIRRFAPPATPSLTNDAPRGRLVGVAAVGAALFTVLIGRLWYLQIVHGADFREAAATSQRHKTRTVPPRGDIVDRNGVVLVTNTARFAVYIVPAQLPRPPKRLKPGEIDPRATVLDRLAALLDTTRDGVVDAMKNNGGGPPSDPVLVATAITQRQVAQIAEHQDELPGVLTQVEPIRRYPLKTVAAHVIGYTKPVTGADLADPKVRKRYRSTDYIGRSGIEKQYDELLAGKEGVESFEVSRGGMDRKTLSVQEPLPGATLSLSLDSRLQRTAEAALAGRKGAVVALDPRNGEVLALASGPSYDLNLWSLRPLPGVVYRQKIKPFESNNALQAFLPPGSTMKIVTLAAGLGSEKIGEGTSVFCNHGLQFRREKLRCMGYHGGVGLYRAFAVSCNAFFGQSGIWIGQEQLGHWSRLFGLGARTGIDLPNEIKGNVDSPKTQEAIYRRSNIRFTGWSAGMSANMAIGQGAMAVTPIQMAQVAAAIAGDGVVYKPHLLVRAVAADGTGEVVYAAKPEPRRLPLAPEKIEIIKRAMFGVVNGPGGTSAAARVPGIRIWGKSGSAESRGKGGPTHAWFTCFAARPNEAPSLVVAVWLDSGGQHLHGGSHAAPIARKLIAQHFGVVDKGPLQAGPVLD